jgi:Flp pilus assembly protein TadD
MLAQAFVARQAYDSALAQLVELERALDRRTDQRVAAYRSKEMIEYAIGMLEYVRGRRAHGDSAMTRALVENFGFWPAHVMLGDAAAAHGEVTFALEEYERALELEPADVILLRHYATALVRANRAPEAVPILRRAVTLEPAYARPWYGLGVVLERVGDAEGAREAYRRYVELAPRGAADQVKVARTRIAALGR